MDRPFSRMKLSMDYEVYEASTVSALGFGQIKSRSYSISVTDNVSEAVYRLGQPIRQRVSRKDGYPADTAILTLWFEAGKMNAAFIKQFEGRLCSS